MSGQPIREAIRHKRDGGELDEADLQGFVSEVVAGSIPDYQAAAMLMAIYFQGMSDSELAAMTGAMIRSGDRLNIFSDQPKVDKHSTGGVGDKVSLCLVPLVASCGVTVPMMSGRGLGHTGGTLDKLESIRGLRTAFSPKEFNRIASRHGVIIAGQSDRIVPADRILYALRDSTATVSSIPLISSSIMSKKLVEGLDGLVLDIKVGSGAFMREIEDARRLAETMIGIGRAHGVATRALLTDMNQPLGREVGNANELAEAISVLRGQGPPDLTEIVRVLGIAMLEMAGYEDSAGLIDRHLASGDGLKKLAEMIKAQGGDPRVVEEPGRLPQAAHTRRIRAWDTGYVTSINTRDIGLAALSLGAGRLTMKDQIDRGVGLTLSAKVGDSVTEGDVLVSLRFNQPPGADRAADLVRQAYTIGALPPDPRPLIIEECN
ncbi:MAG: thymidine phosphorylase [Acidimicrobiia bacterium]|nr:thymidine phosphorylase [Acidimicrobiia bacterium]MYF26033.1 thymidine phosphorylase [Acidimicrobiia bacterium]